MYKLCMFYCHKIIIKKNHNNYPCKSLHSLNSTNCINKRDHHDVKVFLYTQNIPKKICIFFLLLICFLMIERKKINRKSFIDYINYDYCFYNLNLICKLFSETYS